jgi:tol-pal system protein YbgF
MLRPAAVMVLALLTGPAFAGSLQRLAQQDEVLLPPGNVTQDGAQPGDLQLIQTDNTVADLVARVQRLEGLNRQLTGQLEETQNLLRRAQDDFNRYRADTDFRLQALEGTAPGAKPQQKKTAAPIAPPAPPTPATTALGPKNLGSVPVEPEPPVLDDTAATDPLAPEPAAPVVPTVKRPVSPTVPPGLPAVDTSQPLPAQPEVAAVPPAPQTPEEEYSADYKLIESASYEAAELAFRKFISSYPKDRRVADATHWIGESLYQRKQYRDAAEQFLKVTTSYATTKRAPASMLRLGMSLAALGEKDAACATFEEVNRKYPGASTTTKSGVDREVKKNACAAQ